MEGQRDLKTTGLRAGGGDGHGDAEEESLQSYRQTYTMGKTRGKKERAVDINRVLAPRHHTAQQYPYPTEGTYLLRYVR